MLFSARSPHGTRILASFLGEKLALSAGSGEAGRLPVVTRCRACFLLWRHAVARFAFMRNASV